jgi:hypothetical protein
MPGVVVHRVEATLLEQMRQKYTACKGKEPSERMVQQWWLEMSLAAAEHGQRYMLSKMREKMDEWHEQRLLWDRYVIGTK